MKHARLRRQEIHLVLSHLRSSPSVQRVLWKDMWKRRTHKKRCLGTRIFTGF